MIARHNEGVALEGGHGMSAFPDYVTHPHHIAFILDVVLLSTIQ